MADKEWRPDDWMNPFHCMDKHIKTKHDIFEAGASAMLSARDKDWIAWGEQIKEVHKNAYKGETRLAPAAWEMFGRDKAISKAATINAVQYLMGDCPHGIPRLIRKGVGIVRRKDCPLCMAKVNEVLGISLAGEGK